MIDFATKSFTKRLIFIARQIELDATISEEKDFPDNIARYTHVDQYIMMLQNAASIIQNDEIIDEKYMPLLTQMQFSDKKISAIREFRSLFNSGLKEAKDEIERVMNYNTMEWTVDEWIWNGNLIAKGLKTPGMKAKL